MKRIILVSVIAALLFSLCSCVENSNGYDTTESVPTESTQESNTVEENDTTRSETNITSEAESTTTTESNAFVPDNFTIEGKWKSVGSYGFGQAQPGAIVSFDGTNCNFFSPKDTYALYKENGQYILDCTSFMSTATLSFKIQFIDTDNIRVLYGEKVTELKRVQ